MTRFHISRVLPFFGPQTWAVTYQKDQIRYVRYFNSWREAYSWATQRDIDDQIR